MSGAGHVTRPGTSIDPRIRARRIEVQRGLGRRRLRRLVDLGLVLAVAAGFAGALRSPLLDVEQVAVSGAVRTGEATVADAARIQPGDQLMDVDLGALGRRIASLPWVERVELHRGLGGVVRIEVVERVPAAVVGEGDTAVLVDASGRVLAPVKEAPDLASPLLTLLGAGGPLRPGDTIPQETGDALVVAAGLAGKVPGAVARLDGTDGLVLTLASGGEVRFGDASRLATKLRSLETVLAQVDLSCLAVLDLRVPGSPVLTREEPCS